MITKHREEAGPQVAPPQPPFTGTVKERKALGKTLREKCPREAHAIWKPAVDRPDPVQLVLKAEQGRMPDLLPMRHGRMVRSAFTFYRGAALTMAVDLARSPISGVWVQCCGDAHLCNFGGFATPERRVIFGINDLDETLPAPWEWDVKRLAASFLVACRSNGLPDKVGREVVMTCVRAYREAMAEFCGMSTLEMWYHSMTAEELVGELPVDLRRRALKRIERERSKSRGEELFPTLAEHQGDRPLIKDKLPTLFHNAQCPPGEVTQLLKDALASYKQTLPHSTRSLLERYHVRDAAVKVVGVGSVGTVCMVILFTTGEGDPLFLQVKEARASVLEPFAGASVFANHGQRVVNGYRLMQAASDIFLGWTQGRTRQFFLRQLRDVKVSLRVETFGAREMEIYATWCGRALALSHARSGHAAVLSGYMGKSDVFDRALADFAVVYAAQNESDHAALERAVRDGRLQAFFEEET